MHITILTYNNTFFCYIVRLRWIDIAQRDKHIDFPNTSEDLVNLFNSRNAINDLCSLAFPLGTQTYLKVIETKEELRQEPNTSGIQKALID